MSFKQSSRNGTEESVSVREVVNTRMFNTSRERIFTAFCNPNHLARWWGPKGFSNTFHEFDFRPNGLWRYAMRGPDGASQEHTSVFVEVTKPERIVLRHLEPFHEFLLTVTLEESAHDRPTSPGRSTKLTWRMQFDSAEECDKVKRFVAEANEENLDRLDTLLASIAPTARE